jgi:hypothetical protein
MAASLSQCGDAALSYVGLRNDLLFIGLDEAHDGGRYCVLFLINGSIK